MGVPLLDLVPQYEKIRPEVEQALLRVAASQKFILGEEVSAFEKEVASYVGARHAIGVASGTDALLLALRAAGVSSGEEVIVPAFTFFATAGAVVNAGGLPVFVDIERDGYNIDPDAVEAAVTGRTRAIVAVHLFGQCADMDRIREIASRHGVAVIEDAAQAIGSALSGRRAGTLGSAACFSFFPSKNLGGFGDGGLITTDDDDVAVAIRRLRVHGQSAQYHHQDVGFNSRLDALQAAVLRVKLPHLDGWAAGRRANADRYREYFRAADLAEAADSPIGLPANLPGREHVYNQFVIRARHRDRLQTHLREHRIGTAVYYPVPLHRQPCFAALPSANVSLPVAEKASREVLALPVFPELTAEQIQEVVDAVRGFYAATEEGTGG